MKVLFTLLAFFVYFTLSAQNLNDLYQLRDQVEENILELRTQLDTLEKQMYLLEMAIYKKGGTVDGMSVSEPRKPVRYSSPSTESSITSTPNKLYTTPANSSVSTITTTAGPQADQLHTQPSLATSTQTVYITRTGEKYHRGGCRYLRQSKYETDLAKAANQGYTACSVCSPSSVSSKSSTNRPSPNSSTSSRCHATTQKGTRCKRMVRGGSYCWQHS